MRNTRQTSTAYVGSESLTLQQVMEMMQGLQEAMAASKADQECYTPPREFPMPFSQAIMDAVIPSTFVGPKATFISMEDPEAHLTAFHTQMMLVGGSGAVRCKLFMSTLVGVAMD